MTKSSKIVFFGNERLSSGFDPQGAPTLEALITHGYNVVAVVASFESAGVSRKSRELEIEQVAKKHNIPLLLPKKLNEIAETLRALQPDIGVLAAFGKMVPDSIITIFPHGIINIHPSLLPQYRGSTPIEQAMLDGANKTGVSIMGLVQKMDAGPIFAQKSVPLIGDESKQALTRTLLLLGGELLLQQLPAILHGRAEPATQDESKATYTALIRKEDGTLDTTKSAVQLEREVRAYAVWPKSRLTLFDQQVIVSQARVAQSSTDGALVVPCGNASYLEVTQLTAPSGRTMSGADFMRGYKK